MEGGEQDWQPARVEQVDASIALGKCVGLVWKGGEQDRQPARVEQVDASIALGKCVRLVWKGGEEDWQPARALTLVLPIGRKQGVY
jgi:hypothetical protein